MRRTAWRTILFLTLLFIGTRSYCLPVDTMRLFYGINHWRLANTARLKIKKLVDSAGQTQPVTIKGFADYLGGKTYNRLLSRKRANAVKGYLRLRGPNLLITASGEGQISAGGKRDKNGEPMNRRVDIIFSKITVPKDTMAIKPVNDSLAVLLARFSRKIDSLSLQTIGKGISLDELTFVSNRHRLEPEAQPFLEILAQYLKGNKGLIFEIRGHVCCIDPRGDGYDSDDDTYNLSVNRAKEIYKYFLKSGIEGRRMTYKGVGATQPKVYPERSIRDRQLNRRVEIIILNKR